MAYGNDGDDDYQLGMFSMINGVDMKIGEKFKLPERISLPMGWKPSDPSELLQFQYDFSQEKYAVILAEEERLVQVQNNIETDTETTSPDQSNEEEINSDEEHNENEIENKTSVTEILTPFVIPSEAVETKPVENQQKIDLEEFEDHNQNPFESVELQTINELDELRSVLEPGKNKVIKSKVESKSNDNFEFFSGFTEPTLAIPALSNEDYIIDLSDNENDSSNPLKRGREFNFPDHLSKGTLNWTKFVKELSTYPTTQSINTNFEQSISQVSNSVYSNVQISHLPHSGQDAGHVSSPVPSGQDAYTRIHAVPSGQNIAEATQHSDTPNERTEIAPPRRNLSYGEMLFMTDELSQNQNQVKLSKSLPEIDVQNECTTHSDIIPHIPTNIYHQEYSNQPRFNIDQSQTTDRIDSIMKQYQFCRLSDMPVVSTYNMTSTTQVPNLGGNIANVGPTGASLNIAASNANVPTESVSKHTPLPNSVSSPYSISSSSGSNHPIGTFNQSTVNFNNAYLNCPLYTLASSDEQNMVRQPTNVGNQPTNSVNQPTNMVNQPSHMVNQPSHLVNQPSHLVNQPSSMVNQPITANFQTGPANVTSIPCSTNINIPSIYQNNNPFIPSTHNNPQSSDTLYKHGVLPPLPPSNLPSNFNSVPSSVGPIYPKAASPQLTPLNGVIKNKYVHETELRGSQQSPLLPNIPTHGNMTPHIPPHGNDTQIFPFYDNVTTGMTTPNKMNGLSKSFDAHDRVSWLVDPTEELPTHQKNFACQVSAMGFSLPCVSRAIQRLGVDQREVLDFLCSLQDFTEKDFHSDDVEMALVNLKNDKEKVTSYLEMVATFRELGFKPSQIHKALQESACDQNKALDYLTR